MQCDVLRTADVMISRIPKYLRTNPPRQLLLCKRSDADPRVHYIFDQELPLEISHGTGLTYVSKKGKFYPRTGDEGPEGK
jgi:hypothetical protein